MELTLPFLYGIARDLWGLARGKRRALSAAEVIQRREKWQPQFEAWLATRWKDGLSLDVIVRDVKRIDNYPDTTKTKRISPWFRVGLVGTYHRGVKLGLSRETLCRDESVGKWRYSNYKIGEQADVTAALIGFVRYENIESVNWDGDEYYGSPHLYCHFVEKARQPYERLVFCDATVRGRVESFMELAELKAVDRYSKKLRVGRYA